MATRYLTRSLLTTTRHSIVSAFSRSYTAASSAVVPNSSSFLFRIRPLVAAVSSSYFSRLSPTFSTRGFATRPTTSSLNDPNPNWSNRPPKETILLDGCDFEHWLIVMEKPEGDPTRDEIIDSYIKTLAMVVGSEEEARMKIYSVSTRHYFAFGALISEELSYKMKELPKVRWVLPDSYLDVKNKDYGGEPFINGQAVPYDPKYHEEWVRNNARANERNRRNDRPRNFDRSRNFERRREFNNPNSGSSSMGSPGGPGGHMGGPGGPGGHMGGPGGPGGNMGAPGGPGGNMGAPGGPAGSMGAPGGPGGNMGGPVGPGGNMGGASSMHPNAPNPGTIQPNMGGQPNYRGGPPQNNPGNYPGDNMRGPNSGGMPYQPVPGPNQNFNSNPGSGYAPGQNNFTPSAQGHHQNNFHPNPGFGAGQGQGPQSNYGPGGHGPGQFQNNYGSNMGPGPVQHQNAYPPNMGGGNPYQN